MEPRPGSDERTAQQHQDRGRDERRQHGEPAVACFLRSCELAEGLVGDRCWRGELLVQEPRQLRQRGGDVFMMRTQNPVLALFKSTGFYDYLGEDHFLSYGDALGYIFYRVLDPAVCIYECDARAFRECLNLPRPEKLPSERIIPLEIPQSDIKTITPLNLWEEFHQRTPPIVIDIREHREYKQGHIPQATSVPMFKLISNTTEIPQLRQVVLVCRTGRRSSRVIHILNQKGFKNIRILEGGMLAWENCRLLEAIDR